MLARKEKDVFLVVCGSATSWIVENIVHNKGGLHDRLTDRIWLRPFTLRECAEYSAYLGVGLSRHELCQAYMIFGGVPYYWSLLRGDRSFAQNVDALCFSEHGKLRDEFDYFPADGQFHALSFFVYERRCARWHCEKHRLRS